MRQSTRLIVNTLVTYARMALTVGLGLATTRIALSALGTDDFGILATLGASGVLLLALSDALTSSTQRHLAFEIGRQDTDSLRSIFNTSLILFAAMGLIFCLMGLGFWQILQHILSVPEGREAAASQVYFLTLAAIVATILATPYRGLLMARQSFALVAVYDLMQAVLGLAAVVVLLILPGDKLITYAWLLLSVRVSAEGLIVLLTILVVPDSRPRLWLARRADLGKLASFAGWSLFVLLAWRLRVQGSQILLNSFYGSTASASYGLAYQLAGYQNQIGAAVWRAVRPAMSTMEAKGGNDEVRSLTLVSSKYLLFLTLFFLIPVELEAEGVLALWLEHPPPYAAILTRLVLIWTALNWASVGHQMAMEAKGTLGRYAIIMASFDLAVLLVQWTTLELLPKADDGHPVLGPWIKPSITVTLMVAQNVTRAWYVGRILGIPVARWLLDVVVPTLVVASLGAALALVPFLLLPATPWRILLTGAAFATAALPAMWLLGMARWERDHFLRVGTSAVTMLRGRLRR